MAEALVSAVLQQLAVFSHQKIENEVKIVLNVKKDVQKLQNKLTSIQAVLEDAEKKQVEAASVRVWLQRLKDAAYDIDDVLDEWNTEVLRSEAVKAPKASPLKRVWFPIISSYLRLYHLFKRHEIAQTIKEVNQVLDEIAAEKSSYNFITSGTEKFVGKTISDFGGDRATTSDFDKSEVRGRIEDKGIIIEKLLEDKPFCVISIVGMGGVGKTTLAQLVFNDITAKSHVENKVWICVSDPFDLKRIGNAIVESFEENVRKYDELETLFQRIKTLMRGKKFLIVLDDVWTERYEDWEPMKNCLQQCAALEVKILVTTRKAGVAEMMRSTYTHNVKGLSKEDSWSLFRHIAFFGRKKEEQDNLATIGRELVQKCKGLPLAIKVLANLLHLKKTKEQWQLILNDAIWKRQVVEDHLSPALLLSYYDLPPGLKVCFSYCAIFPKDATISREKLIKLWMAQGFIQSYEADMDMEEIGNEYFEELARRSLFQDLEIRNDGSILRFKMHDIVHDLAQHLTKHECLILGIHSHSEPEMNISRIKARHITAPSHVFCSVLTKDTTTKSLRTLQLQHSSTSHKPPPKLLDLIFQFKSLRVIDLSFIESEHIPRTVGDLVHLRYLSFYRNSALKKLPETICNLYNLQSLELGGCHNLENLPKDLAKLINLRYPGIEGSAVQFLPKGILQLRSLRRLSTFVVCEETIEEGCKLRDLKCLSKLKHRLSIEYLENAVDKEDATVAGLTKLKDLRILELRFYSSGAKIMRTEEEVLEALEPPPLLRSLRIGGYNGLNIPSWITLLTELRSLTLHMCRYIEKWQGIPMIEDEEEKPTNCNVLVRMPFLSYFEVSYCRNLMSLPHFLITAPLNKLTIRNCCETLVERCRRSGDYWPKISHIPSIIID